MAGEPAAFDGQELPVERLELFDGHAIVRGDVHSPRSVHVASADCSGRA